MAQSILMEVLVLHVADTLILVTFENSPKISWPCSSQESLFVLSDPLVPSS